MAFMSERVLSLIVTCFGCSVFLTLRTCVLCVRACARACVCWLGTEVGMFLFGGGQSGSREIVKGELLNLENALKASEAISCLVPKISAPQRRER